MTGALKLQDCPLKDWTLIDWTVMDWTLDNDGRILPAATEQRWPVKAKFHYGILVADRSEADRRPVADLLTS